MNRHRTRALLTLLLCCFAAPAYAESICNKPRLDQMDVLTAFTRLFREKSIIDARTEVCMKASPLGRDAFLKYLRKACDQGQKEDLVPLFAAVWAGTECVHALTGANKREVAEQLFEKFDAFVRLAPTRPTPSETEQ